MTCPYCGKEAPWVPNEEVYGRRFGKSYMCYYCKPCNAYVGCHQNTRQPLGTMANAQLRKARMKAHAAVDPLWKLGPFSRGKVYAILSDMFGRSIHIGEADLELCNEIIQSAEKLNHLSKSQ